MIQVAPSTPAPVQAPVATCACTTPPDGWRGYVTSERIGDYSALASVLVAVWAIKISVDSVSKQREWREEDRLANHFERTVLDELRTPIANQCELLRTEYLQAVEEINNFKKDAGNTHAALISLVDSKLESLLDSHSRFKRTINVRLAAWPDNDSLAARVHEQLNAIEDAISASIESLPMAAPQLLRDDEIEILVAGVSRVLLDEALGNDNDGSTLSPSTVKALLASTSRRTG